MTNYTREAELALQKYMETHSTDFHAPAIAMSGNDATFTADLSIEDAANLIAEARRQMKQERERKANQEQSQEALGQRRDDISKLRDFEAERIQREWIDESRTQAEDYAQSKNSGATPKATREEDKPIVDSVISWIEKQRRRGHFGPRKAKA